MLLVRSFLKVLRVLWRLEEKDLKVIVDDVQNSNLKKFMLRKENTISTRRKVATVVADESESPSVVPSVEEEVAIVGESSSVLAPSVFLMKFLVLLLM